MTPSPRNLWSLIASLVLVAVAVVNLAAVVRRTPAAPRTTGRPHNLVMRHEERLGPVRAALEAAAIRGVVGYLGDLPPEEMRADAHAMEQYFLTQYALIPWVLEADIARCDWVVANLHGASPADRVPAGLKVARDFGGGVLLLRRAQP